MKRCLLITALVALPLFVTSSVVALEDTPVFGKVTTKRKPPSRPHRTRTRPRQRRWTPTRICAG